MSFAKKPALRLMALFPLVAGSLILGSLARAQSNFDLDVLPLATFGEASDCTSQIAATKQMYKVAGDPNAVVSCTPGAFDDSTVLNVSTSLGVSVNDAMDGELGHYSSFKDCMSDRASQLAGYQSGRRAVGVLCKDDDLAPGSYVMTVFTTF